MKVEFVCSYCFDRRLNPFYINTALLDSRFSGTGSHLRAIGQNPENSGIVQQDLLSTTQGGEGAVSRPPPKGELGDDDAIDVEGFLYLRDAFEI